MRTIKEIIALPFVIIAIIVLEIGRIIYGNVGYVEWTGEITKTFKSLFR